MDDKIKKPAENLPGWIWIHYDDGSGGLSSPEGKIFFEYDLNTKEYVNPNNGHYVLWYDYPYSMKISEFKNYAEKWIQNNILKKDNISKENQEIQEEISY